MGLPPELLGLNVVTKQDLEAINVSYENFNSDFRDAAQYLNPGNLRHFPVSVQKAVQKAAKLIDFEINEEHKSLTTRIMDDYKKMNFASMRENIIRAGQTRRFLG